MTVLIEDNHVCCPNCGENIEVKQKSSGGASRVRNWTVLPKMNKEIIAVWISSGMRNQSYDKPRLHQALMMHGLKTTENALNARVSELLGLNLVVATPNIKDSPEHTTRKPLYSLHIDNVIKVFNNGGKLK